MLHIDADKNLEWVLLFMKYILSYRIYLYQSRVAWWTHNT